MARAKRFAILIAADGSEEATAAVKATTIFPWPASTAAHGVVVRTPMPTLDIPETVWVDVDRGLTAIAQATRAALARRWPAADVRVVDGPTVSAILKRAQRVGARTIVLGSRGHGPIARLLLGSTSLGVVRGMKHAALVVRGAPRAFARIVVGLDGSGCSRHAVTVLAALEPPAGGQVTLVRVTERASLPSLSMLPAATRTAVLDRAAAADAAEEKTWRRGADAAAAELRGAGWKVETVVRQGAPLHELLEATKTARASLLVVGARGHGAVERLLLGSVAEGALHRAPVSVLVVR